MTQPLPAPRLSLPVLGVSVHHVTMQQTLAYIEQFMNEPGLRQIVTANPDFVMKAQKDEPFRRLIQKADLCVSDGYGLVWATGWLGDPVPERVPGSDLVYHLAQRCAEAGWRLFLLGAAPGIAEKAGARLQQFYPGLQLAGAYSGSPNLAENDAIVAAINHSRADVLYVAYGAPNQDKWIARNREALCTVRVAVGVGGSLDFISGNIKRAPAWVQELRLEWLYRVVQQPARWRRILLLPRFVLSVLWAKWRAPSQD